MGVGGRSALALRGRGAGAGETVRLVVDVDRDLAELVAVLACVVGAEQQLATRLELDSEIGLSSATVAAVRGAERGTRGNCSGHIGLISVFVDAGSNVAGEAKIPSNPPVRRVVRHLIPSRPGYPRGGVSTPRAVPVRDR